VVAETFGQVLESTGRFEQISTLDREPVGADRDRADAVLRVAVPEWGLVRVREGDPSLVSSFAEVRVQMVRPGTGIVIWEAGEDVTNPDRLPMTSFTQDSEFARQELRDVLARAGHRLASEFLYAQEGSR
jgi:hypothetical protein